MRAGLCRAFWADHRAEHCAFGWKWSFWLRLLHFLFPCNPIDAFKVFTEYTKRCVFQEARERVDQCGVAACPETARVMLPRCWWQKNNPALCQRGPVEQQWCSTSLGLSLRFWWRWSYPIPDLSFITAVSRPLPTSRADRITVLIKDCIYFQNFSEQSLDLSVLHAEHGLFVLKLSWCALCALRRSGSEAALSPLFTFSVTAIKQQCFCCSNEVLFHASAPACPGWVVSPQKALCSDPFILCFHKGTLRLLQPFSWRMSVEILQSHSLCITDRSLTW